MLIALPLTENNEFSSHFGAAAKAGLFEVDPATRAIVRAIAVVPPDPEPCSWVTWLGAQGVKLFLAGGMGQGARQRMSAAGVMVVVGVPSAAPAAIVQAWLDSALVPGPNGCEGGQHGHGHNPGEHGHHHPHGEHEHGHGCGCGTH